MSETERRLNDKRRAFAGIKKLGFEPGVVVDVGVLDGTPPLYEAFPQAEHILIEPVAEHERHLQAICSQLPNAAYVMAAAAAETGTARLEITNDLRHSGLKPDTNADRAETHFYREVQTVKVDDVLEEVEVVKDVLLKIDVDGAEIEVLKGSGETLKQCEYVVIEATLFGQIYQVMDFMRERGFVAYDFLEPLYRPHDQALWQVDIAFVKEDGRFREFRGWGN